MNQAWTEDEVEALVSIARLHSSKERISRELAALGYRRSPKAVESKMALIRDLLPSRRRCWTEEEIEVLHRHFREKGLTGVARMIGRDNKTVRRKCVELGLIAPPAVADDREETIEEFRRRDNLYVRKLISEQVRQGLITVIREQAA